MLFGCQQGGRCCMCGLARCGNESRSLSKVLKNHLCDVIGAHGVAVDGCEVQRQVAVGVPRLGVAGVLQQQANTLLVPVASSVVQAAAVLGIPVCVVYPEAGRGPERGLRVGESPTCGSSARGS